MTSSYPNHPSSKDIAERTYHILHDNDDADTKSAKAQIKAMKPGGSIVSIFQHLIL